MEEVATILIYTLKERKVYLYVFQLSCQFRVM